MHVINHVTWYSYNGVSASAELNELESSTSSVDSCKSLRSRSLSCHKTGASVECEIHLSLLDTLQSPRPSNLARKQKIHTNPPSVGKKRSQAGTIACKHNPKIVTPLHMACKFLCEHLAALGGNNFCKACRECLALKRNVVVNHVKCVKHQRSKESGDLSYWSSSVRKVFLVQLSSAAAEHVFSMLNRSFGDQQQNSLEDYMDATILLLYIKR